MATSRFLIVGKYAVGSNKGLHDIDLVDTRVRGGGIKEELVTDFKGSYPQVRWFHDIGHYDGTPFPGATAVLVDLPATLLEVNGGIFNKKQIDSIVKHHLSFGVYPVIRFYCTNTGLIKHETVWDSTGAGTWEVPTGDTCPDEEGTVLCIFQTTTTTTTGASLFFDESFSDDTELQDGGAGITMLWDGGEERWTPDTGASGTASMAPLGGWEVGYRPEEMRVIWGGTTPTYLTIKDTNGATIGEDSYYYSGDLIELTWGSYDLATIDITNPGSDFFLTHIQFRLMAADVSIVDVYTGNDIDDYVGLTGTDWAVIHGAATGDEVGVGNNDETYAFGIDYNVPDTTIRRAFLQFHLSLAANQEIVDAQLYFQGYSLPQSDPVVHEATIDEDALTTADFDAFTAEPIAIPVPQDFRTGWESVCTFTSDGIIYLNSGKDTYVSLCIRDHEFDYLNVDPGTQSSKSGMSFSGGSNPPYLRLYIRTT